jgi:hypothetical protein
MIVNNTILYVDDRQHLLLCCVLTIVNVTILYVDDHRHTLKYYILFVLQSVNITILYVHEHFNIVTLTLCSTNKFYPCPLSLVPTFVTFQLENGGVTVQTGWAS